MSKLPNPHYNKRIYGREWSIGVVTDFCDRYSRGTDNLAKMATVSRITVEKWLIDSLRRQDQTAWELLKKMIKKLQVEKYGDFAHLSVQEKRNYLTYVKYFCMDEILDGK